MYLHSWHSQGLVLALVTCFFTFASGHANIKSLVSPGGQLQRRGVDGTQAANVSSSSISNLTSDPNLEIIRYEEPRVYVVAAQTFLANCYIEFADQAFKQDPSHPTSQWSDLPVPGGTFKCNGNAPFHGEDLKIGLQINDVARRGESVTFGETLGVLKSLQRYLVGLEDPGKAWGTMNSVEFLWQKEGVKRIWGTLKGKRSGDGGDDVKDTFA